MARGRGKLTPQDLEYMKIISKNINKLLDSKGYKQIDLSKGTGIPPSTLTGYVKGTSIPIPGNVQKIADFFNVAKSDIDPRFGKPTTTSTLSLITETSAKLNDDNQLNVLNYATHLYEDEQNSIKESLRLYTVEVVEGLAAGNGFSYGDNETTIYYTDREDLRYYDEASLVVGDSMEPDYPDGSIALIQRGYDSLNGQVYAVDYDGKSFIKKVYNEQSHFRLVSINEKYEDIIIDVPVNEDTHFNIIGKVVDWFTPIEK